MGPQLLIISAGRRGDLVPCLQSRFDGRLLVTAQWPPQGQMAREVLIVDLTDLGTPVWTHLERLSRQDPRPSIILLDDAAVPRQRLARVAADALLPPDAHPGEVIASVDAHTSDHAFRCASRTIKNCDAIPYPLNRFLASAFAEPVCKVSTLAASLSMKESTLRSQWRKWRSDPTLRLEDIVRRAARAHRDARSSREGWRAQLEELTRSILEDDPSPPHRSGINRPRDPEGLGYLRPITR